MPPEAPTAEEPVDASMEPDDPGMASIGLPVDM